MSEPSPRPWKVDPEDSSAIKDATGALIADAYGGRSDEVQVLVQTSIANAALIVDAVNQRADQQKALTALFAQAQAKIAELTANERHFSVILAPLLTGETDHVKAIQLLCKAGRDEMARAERAEVLLTSARKLAATWNAESLDEADRLPTGVSLTLRNCATALLASLDVSTQTPGQGASA